MTVSSMASPCLCRPSRRPRRTVRPVRCKTKQPCISVAAVALLQGSRSKRSSRRSRTGAGGARVREARSRSTRSTSRQPDNTAPSHSCVAAVHTARLGCRRTTQSTVRSAHWSSRTMMRDASRQPSRQELEHGHDKAGCSNAGRTFPSGRHSTAAAPQQWGRLMPGPPAADGGPAARDRWPASRASRRRLRLLSVAAMRAGDQPGGTANKPA